MINAKIKRLGLLTSGGDAPGMNAAIRAVVRAAVYYGIEPIGIYRGYDGLMQSDFQTLNARSVSNIIQRGGTILKTARSTEFMTEEGRAKAYQNLREQNIDALVVIGGDGTFRGANALIKEHNLPIIGIPCTIDNDLAGTDFTIGFDTACNTVIHAIDNIRDTAQSHNRLFFIEVMGRDSGFIALRSAVAAGVEAVLIPEQNLGYVDLIRMLEKGAENKKSSSLVVVAEGGKTGGAAKVAAMVREKFPHYDSKVTVLGHVQRGGSPSCLDREMASRLGVAAVEGLGMEKKGVMVGVIYNQIVYSPFSDIVNMPKPINMDVFRINEILSV